MRLLSVDTALGACTVGVLEDGVLTAWSSEPMARGHQERIAPMAAEAIARAGLAFADLDRIVVCVGPGSFTGVRVGVAFAKGLASALSIPCVGIGALEALAAGSRRPAVVAAIDARRDQLYLQAFHEGAPVTTPSAVPLAEAQAWVRACLPHDALHLVGPGAELLASQLASAIVDVVAAPHPARLAELGAGAEPEANPSRPLYLRPPEARTIEERRA